jgi:hypothetical protein
VLITYTFFPISSYAEDTAINTIGGILSIVKKENEFRGSNIIFNKKSLLPDDVMYIEFREKYRIGRKDIIVISITDGANGNCSVKYHFISITPKKSIFISPSIDCHAEAELKTSQDHSKIIGLIPKLHESGNDKYVFENGRLSENGKMLHK